MSAGTWSSTRKTAAESAAFNPILVLKALGSLKITVVLFFFAIVIVLVGTLAQDEQTMVQVKRDYFNSWIALVPVDVFLPQTMYEHSPEISGIIPLPGGALIGLGLILNLFAAKATRFSIQAKGFKLAAGLAVLIFGMLLIGAVILTGHTTDGLQGDPPISYDQLWVGIKIGMLVISTALLSYGIMANQLPKLVRWIVWLSTTLLAALSFYLLFSDFRLDNPGLRIVWQLFQATLASSVLLAGLNILFGKRGGNMLIHVGIALLMVGQFAFGERQIEQKMYLNEGASTNVSFSPDQYEIALIDTSNPNEDLVTVIPDARLRQAIQDKEPIDDEKLPCLVRIDQWFSNSSLQNVDKDSPNPATNGFGLIAQAVERRSSGGAKSTINLPAAYVTFIDRQTKKPLDTLLLAQQRNDAAQLFRSADSYEKLNIGGKPFEVGLRFRKYYKPYTVTLKDVARRDYANSDTPRDYYSIINISNDATQITEKTWMNNPVRFAGETFYQSDYFPVPLPGGRMSEGTGLQVVENAGWVIPYVCCMMVMVGMLSHFGGTFVRFSNRIAREQAKELPTVRSRKDWLVIATSAALALAFSVSMGMRAGPRGVVNADWQAIGKLPVKQDGRVKPADTVAANTLQYFSEQIFGGLPYVTDADGNKRPRVEWLMGVMTDQPWTHDVQVFRVYAKEVRDLLGLPEPRDKFRYTYNEIQQGRKSLIEEMEKQQSKAELNFREQKIAEMYKKLMTYDLLVAAYEEPRLPGKLESNNESELNRAMFELERLDRRYRAVESMLPPAFIPPVGTELQAGVAQDATWLSYAPARFKSILDQVRNKPVSPAIEAFGSFLEAVRQQDGKAINTAERKYRNVIGEFDEVAQKRAQVLAEFELSRFAPTKSGIYLYLLAMIAAIAALSDRRAYFLKHSATGLLIGVFIVHTLGLLARMYISGRAPVVNLYSSAVFIGWGCVLICLILEFVMSRSDSIVGGLSVANLVGSMIGMITLYIAGSLDSSDTLHVLAAVLDTQFWLSTHVVIINLGYSVTFLGGFFGAIALILMVARGDSGQNLEQIEPYKQIYRMAYFSICFGILFSFVGTVLGGLWADDSWGRFWGWDPKENGALMIVLWNAIVLHARWDRMVSLRGFSILALVGNIVTSWSWFGTNLLGIGLHNYGFSKSVAMALLVTVVVHSAIIVVALATTSLRAQSKKQA
jgi:ABC-type transport system involved in cytochrome c biogenesis permease subunit